MPERYETHARRVYDNLVENNNVVYVRGFITALARLAGASAGSGSAPTARFVGRPGYQEDTPAPPADRDAGPHGRHGVELHRLHGAEPGDARDAELARLRTEMVKLRDLLKVKEDEIVRLRVKVSEGKEKIERLLATKPEVEGYLPAPQKDGSFDGARLSKTVKQGISIFSVWPDRAAGLLEFKFLEDPETMKKILSHTAGYLEPVADAENGLTSSTRSVVVTAPGRLVKQGGRFLLKERMKVRYE